MFRHIFDRRYIEGDFFGNQYDDEADDELGVIVSISEYLEIASGIALATILLLPQLMDVRATQGHFTANHVFIILVFLSLALCSIPPSFGYISHTAKTVSLVPVLGAVLLVLVTFFYPAYNYIKYEGARPPPLPPHLLKPRPQAKTETQTETREPNPNPRKDQQTNPILLPDTGASDGSCYSRSPRPPPRSRPR